MKKYKYLILILILFSCSEYLEKDLIQNPRDKLLDYKFISDEIHSVSKTYESIIYSNKPTYEKQLLSENLIPEYQELLEELNKLNATEESQCNNGITFRVWLSSRAFKTGCSMGRHNLKNMWVEDFKNEKIEKLTRSIFVGDCFTNYDDAVIFKKQLIHSGIHGREVWIFAYKDGEIMDFRKALKETGIL